MQVKWREDILDIKIYFIYILQFRQLKYEKTLVSRLYKHVAHFLVHNIRKQFKVMVTW